MPEKLNIRLVSCRKATGQTQKEFAREIGVSEPTMNHYETGKRVPNAEFLARLIEYVKCDPGWLLTGRGESALNIQGDTTEGPCEASKPASEGYVYVPRFQWDLGLEAQIPLQSSQIVDHLAFRSEWVRSELEVEPAELILMSHSGDAMEPTLRSGDLLLVHCQPGKVSQEGIYLMSMPRGLCIRRIEWQSEGAVILNVDNPKASSKELHLQIQVVLENVIGRVVWMGRSL